MALQRGSMSVSLATQSQPWYVGSNGATNFTRHEAQKFARKLVESQDYKDSLERRIKSDSLPAAVECMLWHYAYGKPIEQVALTVIPGTEDLSSLSVDELLKRAKDIGDKLEEAKALAEAIPADILQGRW